MALMEYTASGLLLPHTTLEVNSVTLHLIHTAGTRVRSCSGPCDAPHPFVPPPCVGALAIYGPVAAPQLFPLGDVALLFGESPMVFTKARMLHSIDCPQPGRPAPRQTADARILHMLQLLHIFLALSSARSD